MKRPRNSQTRPPMPPGEAWDPLAAVPLIAEGVEAREDSRGMLQIRRSPPDAPGLGSFLARRLGLRRCVRVNLDDYGSAFWRQIDGRRSLKDIERIVRQRTQQDEKENEKATILFTRMLMLRHLIHLSVPNPEKDGA